MWRNLKNQWENLETIDQTHPICNQKPTNNRPKIYQKNYKKPRKNYCRSFQKRIGIHGRFRDPLGEPPGQFFCRFWAPSWTQPWRPRKVLDMLSEDLHHSWQNHVFWHPLAKKATCSRAGHMLRMHSSQNRNNSVWILSQSCPSVELSLKKSPSQYHKIRERAAKNPHPDPFREKVRMTIPLFCSPRCYAL